jgi:hypothetical protein
MNRRDRLMVRFIFLFPKSQTFCCKHKLFCKKIKKVLDADKEL